MSFAISHKQQQQQQLITTTAPIATTAYTDTTLATSAVDYNPVANLYLPKTFTTAQNCPSNFSTEPAAGTAIVVGKAKLMIRNIENSSNHTDWDENEKEEENENCNMPARRDTAREDTTKPQTSRLNSVQESSEQSDALPAPATPSLASNSVTNLKALETLSSSALVAADITASTSSANLSLGEEQTQQLTHSSQEQQQQNTGTSCNESFDNSTLINSTNQIADNSVSSTNVTKETELNATTTVAAATATTTSPDSSSANWNAPTTTDSPPRRKSSTGARAKLTKTPSLSKISFSASNTRPEEDTISKSSDTSGELIRASVTQESSSEKPKSGSRLSERAKKKSWYNVLYPNYKSRAQDFKKLFKEVPNDERLIVDYSCALQRDILVQGRLYVSQNYVCFHANIFRWETYLSIKWKDVTAITKEKTALVIPNAISICTAKEKYFFATFTTRDKAFLMLFRVWQNTLMNKQMPPQEMWQWVHNCYGDELGLTTDDEDYIDPTSVPTIDNEGDLDFVSALEDNSSLCTAGSGATTDYNSATSNQSINQINNTNNSGNSSTSSGSVGKAKTKSYFFSSSKTSNFNSSTTASASGSDNKASDNNSGVDSKTKKRNEMKANAKELTLMSAKPEEGAGSAGDNAANDSGSGGGSGGAGLGAIAKEPAKNQTTNQTTANHDGTKRKVSKNNRQRDESLSKNSAQLPTDISDSSDSEETKIPFVTTAECTSTHEGRQLMHTILPINIDTLFNLLFSKSKFLVDFHAMRKTADLSFGDWITGEDGKRTRTVNLTVQLSASVGPKNSKVTEYQEMRDCSKPGELYAIDINSVNAGIPYADSFSVLMHYCLVRTVDDHTMLSVHAQIKYKKSIWGVVKGFIEKNTWAGLEDFYTSQLHALQSETCIPPAKGKGRRPRRGTASQIRPLEESAIAQAKAEPAESTLATHPLTPHLPIAPHQLVAGGEPVKKYRWLSLFVIVLLFFLIVLNVILLLKLWKLEERIEDDLSSRAQMPNLASLKQLPSTHQDWLELLRQQEILHETELKKWHKVLQTAIELLKKTEKTLAALMFR